MGFIKNFDDLATTGERKVVLSLIENALQSIQPQNVLESKFNIVDNVLTIENNAYDLSKFQRVFLIGFGKGSAGISKIIEKKLGTYLTAGFVSDVVDASFSSIYYTKGTHPLPSRTNLSFSEQVLSKITNLAHTDLVLVVICGGGSVMFDRPFAISLEKLIEVNQALLKSGATISEMNVIRKHLSLTKGGGLAKHLYPAVIQSLVFSDVPGNDLSVIASGPTYKDSTTLENANQVIEKYGLSTLGLQNTDFQETPKEDKYFENVKNSIIVSNVTALIAMQKKAESMGYKATVYSDKQQGDARELGKFLIDKTSPGEILLCAGESTLKVKSDSGKGGRNQAFVLASLPYIMDRTVIASFDSDGQDFYHFAGAIADTQTIVKAASLEIDPTKYLETDNSYEFWEKTGDGIFTDKLDSNVSDLMIVSKI